MHVTICGSMAFKREMEALAVMLQRFGHHAEFPDLNEGHSYEGKAEHVRASEKRGFIAKHLEKIGRSDAILVVNNDKHGIANYIGANTLIEMGVAFAQGLDIFLMNPIPDSEHRSEIRAMEPVVVFGNFTNMLTHRKRFPRVTLSSTSDIKILATSRAFRRAGIPVNVTGHSVDSEVSAQPQSIAETYIGAKNRHAALKETLDPTSPRGYAVTIESGVASLYPGHNVFGIHVVIVETAEGVTGVSISSDIEFPIEMTERVPRDYPDLGVLVQREYGSTNKDPYPFFTGGRLTRAKILEAAVFNAIVRIAT